MQDIFDHVQSVQARQPEIEDQHVWPKFLNDRHHFEAVADLSDHDVAGGFHDPPKAGANERVVVGDYDSSHGPNGHEGIVDAVWAGARPVILRARRTGGSSTVTNSDASGTPERKTVDEAGSGTVDAVRRFSHDVVSPLMSVLALSEVLLLESRNDDRLTEDLRRIHAAAEEALSLVRALNAEVTSDKAGDRH